jgi:hypothetical protein
LGQLRDDARWVGDNRRSAYYLSYLACQTEFVSAFSDSPVPDKMALPYWFLLNETFPRHGKCIRLREFSIDLCYQLPLISQLSF